MTDDQQKALESILARNARQYLQTKDQSLERALSSDFEFLLQHHWNAAGLSRWVWFDGLIRSEYSLNPPYRLSVLGLMVWGDTGTTQQWVDIFSAELQLAERGDSFTSYVLRFGCKGHEGRKLYFDKDYRQLSRELKCQSDDSWAYIFKGP